MLLFEKKNGQIRMVLDCNHVVAINLAKLVLDALSWSVEFRESKNYMKSLKLMDEKIDLEEGEQIILVDESHMVVKE